MRSVQVLCINEVIATKKVTEKVKKWWKIAILWLFLSHRGCHMAPRPQKHEYLLATMFCTKFEHFRMSGSIICTQLFLSLTRCFKGTSFFIYQFCSGQAVCPSCPDFWDQAFEGNCPNNDRIIVIPCKALFMRFCPDLALILLDFVQNLPGFGLFFFLQIELGLRIGHTVAEATFLGKLLQTGLIIFTQA